MEFIIISLSYPAGSQMEEHSGTTCY